MDLSVTCCRSGQSSGGFPVVFMPIESFDPQLPPAQEVIDEIPAREPL